MRYEINVFEGNNFAYKAVANEAGTIIERVPTKYSNENGPITSYVDKSLIDPQIQAKAQALREAKTQALKGTTNHSDRVKAVKQALSTLEQAE
ncbi:hypothetical protein [Priestia megaterium]|uniref:hypothetical protein n=1 Tax=Priestia megaterium TaxID=1404 RepID=UPI002E1B92DC|nr:hypothetical protein [Priestia megaterium]